MKPLKSSSMVKLLAGTLGWNSHVFFLGLANVVPGTLGWNSYVFFLGLANVVPCVQ